MRWITLILLVFSFALAGCDPPALVVGPLYDWHDKAPVDKRIEGEWVTPNIEKSRTKDDDSGPRWTVGEYSEDYGYTFTLRALPEDGHGVEQEVVTTYKVRLVPIGDKLFFDAEFQGKKAGPQETTKESLSPGVVALHLVGRIWIQQDLIRLAVLDSNWVMGQAPEKLWQTVYHSDEREAVLTASPEDVRALLLREADNHETFKTALYLCRPGVACASRVEEEELSLLPDDSKTIDDAAEFFLRQGNYTRGVALRRRAMELKPKIYINRVELIEALLLNREFEAARREVAAARQLEQLGSVEHEYFCSSTSESYFFEGKYNDAVKPTADCPNRKYTFAEAILFNYFALLRLGRAKEAQFMLQKETAAFRGLLQDHVLLLNFQDRLENSTHAPGEKIDPWRLVFEAMKWASEGETAKAGTALQEFVKTGDRADLSYLAAQIELERLGQSVTH